VKLSCIKRQLPSEVWRHFVLPSILTWAISIALNLNSYPAWTRICELVNNITKNTTAFERDILSVYFDFKCESLVIQMLLQWRHNIVLSFVQAISCEYDLPADSVISHTNEVLRYTGFCYFFLDCSRCAARNRDSYRRHQSVPWFIFTVAKCWNPFPLSRRFQV
jgi:hypothetical protein